MDPPLFRRGNGPVEHTTSVFRPGTALQRRLRRRRAAARVSALPQEGQPTTVPEHARKVVGGETERTERWNDVVQVRLMDNCLADREGHRRTVARLWA